MDPENELKPTETPIEDEPELSPADAAVAEMGLDDDAPAAPDSAPDHPETPETPETPVPETPETPETPADPAEKPEKITDEDLAPLTSGNKATQERFKKVTEGYKEEREAREALAIENERYKESFDALRGLGFTDESAAQDLVALSGYRHVMATGDAENFSKIIAEQIREFESVHGKKVTIQASALDNFPDLKDKIDNLELDEDTALELARSRSIQQRAQRDLKAQNEERVKTQTAQSEIDSATATIETMQETWKRTDPDFALIYPHLRELVPDIGRNNPAHRWPELIETQYKALKRAMVAASTSRPSAQPIRGNGRMSTQAAPQNPVEATLQDMGFDLDE